MDILIPIDALIDNKSFIKNRGNLTHVSAPTKHTTRMNCWGIGSSPVFQMSTRHATVSLIAFIHVEINAFQVIIGVDVYACNIDLIPRHHALMHS